MQYYSERYENIYSSRMAVLESCSGRTPTSVSTIAITPTPKSTRVLPVQEDDTDRCISTNMVQVTSIPIPNLGPAPTPTNIEYHVGDSVSWQNPSSPFVTIPEKHLKNSKRGCPASRKWTWPTEVPSKAGSEVVHVWWKYGLDFADEMSKQLHACLGRKTGMPLLRTWLATGDKSTKEDKKDEYPSSDEGYYGEQHHHYIQFDKNTTIATWAIQDTERAKNPLITMQTSTTCSKIVYEPKSTLHITKPVCSQ
ncbi:hypothetical protein P153DRAFT_356974 [Dothidotthia symphoricarpi CBS 119687]|uniref:Uncharacterized protein n=1 Tax=Dothidotthia symphoricarpi CBS 119687 TaxID=1392245 RepID=A0A6A6AEM1_9PLEO|nr:uncharacterized protein P153DRAFT_356974 [Dothidotthia symphoricarpi CBS 119687]KAF2129394.1 hypothetical protein P153DRAFT_356974 [Dothidotthia symphoricarpi CBS 119687]